MKVKRLLLLVITLLLTVALVACSGKTDKDDNKGKDKSDSQATEETAAEDDQDKDSTDDNDDSSQKSKAVLEMNEPTLRSDLRETAYFILEWFIVYSDKLEGYSDTDEYPWETLFPVVDENIKTYDDLLEETENYTDHDTAVSLLELVGAQDKNGKLYMQGSGALGIVPDESITFEVTPADENAYDLLMKRIIQGWDIQFLFKLTRGEERWIISGDTYNIIGFAGAYLLTEEAAARDGSDRIEYILN